MTPAERFGKRLRQLRREKSYREERDVEQSEVAAAVKDTQPNFARYENGRIPRDETLIKRIAAYYGVQWLWLLHGEGQRELPSDTEVELKPPATAPARPVVAQAGAKRRPRR